MKALVCREFGSPESLDFVTDWPVPDPGDGEILIETAAAGINFPDLLMIAGHYQVRPPRPFVPGMEVAGRVAAIGQRVRGFAIGDRVAAMTETGAFAEYCVVPAAACIAVGDALSSAVAAGFVVTYGTSYYALRQRARLAPGETVLVLGASGGVGVAAVQIAKALGASVIAAASNSGKLEFAQSVGADLVIDYSTEDLKARVRELTGGRGADVIYDPVGGELADPAFRSIARDGRYLVIGFASGTIPKLPFNLALLKSASLVGVFWGSWAQADPAGNQANFRELLALVDEGKLDPPTPAEFALAEFARAGAEIAERRVRGKTVLIP